ncbi:hypothetical protein T09_7982 [Trichinella sp. T9]|nr:hypothetical protein T09_7982 [Trichinella sp. T9]
MRIIQSSQNEMERDSIFRRFWIMLVHDRPVRSISFSTTAALPGNTGQLLSLEAPCLAS